MSSDSPAYLEFHPARMEVPLYPLFLQLVRLLPYPNNGLYEGYTGVYQAVLLQSLLWGYTTYRIGLFVMEVYVGNRNCAERKEEGAAGKDTHGIYDTVTVAISLVTVCLQFTVVLLNRFAVPSRALYSNRILSEAVSMPLFLLFMIHLYGLTKEQFIRHSLWSTFLSYLLALSRGHMKIVFPIWGDNCVFVFCDT